MREITPLEVRISGESFHLLLKRVLCSYENCAPFTTHQNTVMKWEMIQQLWHFFRSPSVFNLFHLMEIADLWFCIYDLLFYFAYKVVPLWFMSKNKFLFSSSLNNFMLLKLRLLIQHLRWYFCPLPFWNENYSSWYYVPIGKEPTLSFFFPTMNTNTRTFCF